MGRTIKPNASKDRILGIALQTHRTTAAMEYEVHDMGEQRLAAPLARYAAAASADASAREKEAAARTAVLQADENSKDSIRLMKDTMWNLLGRPRRNAQMDHVFPESVNEYLPKAPEEQPMMMRVLVMRLDGISSRRFTEEIRTSWVNRIEDLRVKEEAALAALEPLVVAARVTRSEVKTAVAAVRLGLLALKRDMQLGGMSEAQIHEI